MLFSTPSEKASLAAIAAACLLQQPGQAAVDLTNAAMPKAELNPPPLALVMTNSGGVQKSLRPEAAKPVHFTASSTASSAEDIALLRSAIKEERARLMQRRGLYHERTLTALNELENSLAGASREKIDFSLRKYARAAQAFQAAQMGVTDLAIGFSILLYGALGVFRPSVIRAKIDKVINRPAGLDFRDREFLEERMASAASRTEVLRTALDVLSYIRLRLQAPDVERLVRSHTFAFLAGSIGAGLVVSGLGFLTGSPAVIGAASLAVPVIVSWAAWTGPFSLQRRGQAMIKRYKEWCAAQEAEKQ